MENELAVQAARTILIGTLAPDNINGLFADQIADAMLSPQHEDYGIIATAVRSVLNQAIHIDDNADSDRKRFSREANVMKQLIEARDSLRADTTRMEDLLRSAITSAYSGGNRQNPQMKLTVFPNAASNVPDDPEQVCLGIINPEFFNWADAHDPSTKMTNNDLLNLQSHSMGNNGRDFRANRNNAMFLVPHDRNLDRIRQNIATMEAADRLLKDPNQKIQEHRRQTLTGIRAEAEKNAMSGIQNKWSHLICPGTSQPHQWPQSGSLLEHHPLSSTSEPAGNGQKQILDQLGDRILYGDSANISPSAWEQIPLLRREAGTVLGDLRLYFSATPAERSVINQAAWLNLVRTGIQNDGLSIETPAGEINPPTGYDPGWLAWATKYKPKKEDTGPGPGRDIINPIVDPITDPDPTNSQTKSTQTDLTQAGVAAKAIEEFMKAQGHTWDKLRSCTITSTTAEFADQVASIIQGTGEGISISLTADSQDINLELRNMDPQTFKRFSSSAKRMLQLADVKTADVTIKADAKGAEEILGKLNNSHTARINVAFE